MTSDERKWYQNQIDELNAQLKELRKKIDKQTDAYQAKPDPTGLDHKTDQDEPDHTPKKSQQMPKKRPPSKITKNNAKIIHLNRFRQLENVRKI